MRRTPPTHPEPPAQPAHPEHPGSTRPDRAGPPPQRETAAPRSTPVAIACGAAIGIVGAVLGLHPWLLAGARMPLQNLQVAPEIRDVQPMVLLPISQYQATVIVALLVTGGLIAALAIRPLSRSGRVPAWAGSAGLGVTQAIAIAQSVTISGIDIGVVGGEPRLWAIGYLVGMLAGMLIAAAAAQLVYWFATRPNPATSAASICLAAVPAAAWVATLTRLPLGEDDVMLRVNDGGGWVSVLIVVLALAWCGRRPGWRALAWIAALALLVTPPLFHSVATALGTRAYFRNPLEMLDLVVVSFARALPMAALFAVAAVIVAAGIVLVREHIARRRTRRTRPPTAVDDERRPAV
ncbi:MAG: hypothetical protein ACTH31_13745 [Pseudoclavibacter sp.]